MKVVSQREDLIYLLNQAAELEHGLACSYLFSAFSLKANAEEGLSPEAVPTIQHWKQVLRGIAIEEMGHLGVVCNLLTAIGGAPHMSRPNFPQSTSYYLPDYSLALQPFSESTLQHFIYVERPESHEVRQVVEPQANEPLDAPTENQIGPNPQHFETVGAFYEAVEKGLVELVDRLGPEKVFIGRREARTKAEHLAFGNFPPIKDLSSALAAINLVIEEGEGDRGNRKDSHYGRFRRIEEEYRQLKAKDSSFQPALAVVENPFPRTPPLSTGEIKILTDSDATDAADLFDATYALMLQLLGRYFASSEESGQEMELLSCSAIETMSRVLSPLGEMLCRLPAFEDSAERAGPSFGLYRVMHLLPHRDAAHLLLLERYEELAVFAAALADRRPEFSPIASSMNAVAKQLGGSS